MRLNRLLADGLVELVPNADHRRSQLVRLTELGERRYRTIDEKQAAWVKRARGGPTPVRARDDRTRSFSLRELERVPFAWDAG